MAMTKAQIEASIRDRMLFRWPRHFRDNDAAPVFALGICQAAGNEHGQPVLCTTEEIPIEMLAQLLEGTAALLRQRETNQATGARRQDAK